MNVKAQLKFARISAQKARLVADQVRNMHVGKATNLLIYSNKKAAGIINKLLQSAIANAEHNEGADIDELVVREIYVNEGPVHKRMQARAKGRGNRVEKRTCHITIVVSGS